MVGNSNNQKTYVRLVSLLACWAHVITVLRCEAFQTNIPNQGPTLQPKLRHPTLRNVLAEPSLGSFSQEFPQKKSNIVKHKSRNSNYKRNSKKEDVWSSGKWSRALQVESKLLLALEAFQNGIKLNGAGNDSHYPLPFPGIRECNAALAAFGDGGDLLRALRLYFKMRKAASLSQRYPSTSLQSVPIPTLVTFSTLMSRAVHLGKPQVALRLWNIMQSQPDFFSSDSSLLTLQRMVPDVRSANILMNCYSKLGDLDAAQDLLNQMVLGGGKDVPPMSPNLVTYNTLLDACHKSGELDVALKVKEQLESTGMRSDARTYTTLIATVARKASVASGANDPTLAFSFLQEMQTLDIRPNGMTYSALVDVCGRCRRSDLALKGLRLMLDQKAQEQKLLDISRADRYTLTSEVGAWTAAINACGKAGRIDTAVKLFYSMPNFGVSPNTVTCGCLTDCLLRNGKTAESLDVLRYMKKNRIAPSEVMYTSLMTSAGRLAQFENERQNIRVQKESSKGDSFPLDDSGATKAVEVYTELMTSLMQSPNKRTKKGIDAPTLLRKSGDDSNELYRVSLVFQEMKAGGVEPDLACYNAFLKSCADAGDVDRAGEALDQIRASTEMEPNDKTWREIIRAAGKAKRVDIALSTWQTAVKEIYQREERSKSRKRKLTVGSLGALLTALLGTASDDRVDMHTKTKLYQVVVKMYEASISGSNYLGMDLVDQKGVTDSARVMTMFLRAVVFVETVARSDGETGKFDPARLRQLAISIVSSQCFKDGLPYNLRKYAPQARAYEVAQSWFNNERWS